MLRLACAALLVTSSLAAHSQNSKIIVPTKTRALTPTVEADSTARLPVKRVVLYKNGIGYFEHTSRVHGNQDLAIDFTSGQLNDVLKSLTVVDLGQGRIASVRYNSVAPLDERLRSLRLPFGEEVNSVEFLQALRGARVEVRSGASSATGRLLSVEKERKQNGKGDYADTITFSIITDSGEMKNFDLGPATTVRVADREINQDVGRYLNLIGGARARDLRRMTISAVGTGDREVFVSYISEVPVWKSTYRIILPDKPNDKPLLQGWAIIDNTVGEDWKDVELALIAGAPQSFIQDVSQPYYTRRPVVAPPSSLMLSPQTHEATMNAPAPPPAPMPAGTGGLQGTVKDPSGAVVSGARVTVRNEETGASQTGVTDANGNYRFYNVPAGNSALFVEARGFNRYALSNIYLGVGRVNEIHPTLQLGSAAETVEVTAATPTVETSEAMLSTAYKKQGSEAEGQGFGDFFQYQIKQPITISQNQSAMVPILSAPIEVEKVTLWSSESSEDNGKAAQALRALWIRNTSGQTLDSGTFNIIERDTFAGEGVFDTIHPGERRLLSYAADTAVKVAADSETSQRPITRIRVAKGLMLTTREERETHQYKIRNADDTARQVILEDPVEEGWRLVDEGPKPEESTASFNRFRVSVAPASTAALKIETYHPLETTFALTNLNEQEVAVLGDQQRLTPEMKDAFSKILAQKNSISGIDAELQARKQELDAIAADQARLRENMKALRGSAEEKALIQRYTRQLDQQEDRLTTLRSESDALRAKRTAADQELTQMIQQVVLDEKF